MEQTSRELLPRIVRALSVGMAAVAVGACVTTVEPPLIAGDAVEVYLLDHGRTPSLVLPTGTGELTRYAYGDWQWYALGEHGIAEGAAALLWPTPAALGRQALGGPREASTVQRQVFVEIEELHAIRVGRQQAAALAARLDALFARAIETLVQNDETGLAFVRHPEPYHFFHNSNPVVASWLRELDCRVRDWPLPARWRVKARSRSR